VTRLPKRFTSFPYRFMSIEYLIFVAPFVAIVGATGGALLALACGLLVALYAVLVMWRVGVVATREGVVLRSYVRSRHIPWQDVDHFEDEDTGRYRAYVVLVSDERVKITGIGPSLGFREHTMAIARRHIAALNSIRSEVSSGDHVGE
jgi:Bacterial PH domain